MQKNFKYESGFRNKPKKMNDEKKNFSTNSKLYLNIDGNLEREQTNQQEWERTIRCERIGAFGKRFQSIMNKGKWDYTTLRSMLDIYPIKPLLKDTDEYWKDDAQLSDLQELNAITDQSEKQWRKNQMVKAWRMNINAMNSIIENENHINKSMQKLLIDEDKEYHDKCTIFFADLWSSIEYDSQAIIERFKCKRGEVKLGKWKDREDEINDDLVGDEEEESTVYSTKNDTIDYDTAMSEGNWMWLIYATRETHISVIKCDNSWDNRMLMRNAENKWRSLRFKHGSWYRFLTTWINARENALRLGSKCTALDSIMDLVAAIPDDLFGDLKRDFDNPRSRKDHFPEDFEEFVKLLESEFDRIRISKPKLVAAYLSREQTKREDSFKVGKRVKQGSNAKFPPRDGCLICGGTHWASDCEHSIPGCSLAECKRRYERSIKDKHESHEDSDGSSASSDKDDEEDDEETEEKPKLAEKKTKASKGTVVRKTTFKEEKANYCFEGNIEDVAKTGESTAGKAANVQVYDELVDPTLFAAVMRTEALTAAVRTG
jgi:hypothetical protein